MAPSILSNSSILLADAVVEGKSTDLGTSLYKKPQKVTKIFLIQEYVINDSKYTYFPFILIYRKRHIFEQNHMISCGRMS